MVEFGGGFVLRRRQGDRRRGRDLLIYSADRSFEVHVVKDRWWVIVGRKRLALVARQSNVGCPAELSWSPDNKAIYITQSDGSIGGFHTDIYVVSGDSLNAAPDITQEALRDFNRKRKCVQRVKGKLLEEDRNIAGVKWAKGSSRLLVAVEIRPDSLCAQRGYFAGYLVAVPGGEILARYSPIQLLRVAAGELGPRLKGDFADLSREDRAQLP
jgi:hypothetical protein